MFHDGWHMGWMAVWWVLVLVALGVVLWFVVKAIRRLSRGERESAEQVLQRRYAAGEIDRQSYERMLHDLRT